MNHELDWRRAGFVAVSVARFPHEDEVAHKYVRSYADPTVDHDNIRRVRASDVTILPACGTNVGGPFMEITPAYAESRGAHWCTNPECER